MNNIDLLKEFEFLLDDEVDTTYEEDSDALIKDAYKFLNDTKNTYQGIEIKNIKELISIGKTQSIPWNHVVFTIDVSRLKPISGDYLRDFIVPSFVEELNNIGYNNGTEFGYNQAYRNKLKHIEIPSNIIVMSNNIFTMNFNLEKVSFKPDCKLLKLGNNAFSLCDKLNTLDLRNCVYLDTLDEKVFTDSNIIKLKINSNIQHMNPLENTKIQYIYIDNQKYNIAEFNEKLYRSNKEFGNNEVFWVSNS